MKFLFHRGRKNKQSIFNLNLNVITLVECCVTGAAEGVLQKQEENPGP